MTKELLDSCVGIHPTIAEDAIGLKYTKEENPNASKTGCWGWASATVCTISKCHEGAFDIDHSVAKSTEVTFSAFAKLWCY